MRNAQRQFQEIIKLSPALSEQVKDRGAQHGGSRAIRRSHRGKSESEPGERQNLLETPSVKERLTRLAARAQSRT